MGRADARGVASWAGATVAWETVRTRKKFIMGLIFSN